MNPEQFVAVALDVRARFPHAVLEKNAIGNLTIREGDAYRAWVDLLDGEVHLFGEEEPDAQP